MNLNDKIKQLNRTIVWINIVSILSIVLLVVIIQLDRKTLQSTHTHHLKQFEWIKEFNKQFNTINYTFLSHRVSDDTYQKRYLTLLEYYNILPLSLYQWSIPSFSVQRYYSSLTDISISPSIKELFFLHDQHSMLNDLQTNVFQLSQWQLEALYAQQGLFRNNNDEYQLEKEAFKHSIEQLIRSEYYLNSIQKIEQITDKLEQGSRHYYRVNNERLKEQFSLKLMVLYGIACVVLISNVIFFRRINTSNTKLNVDLNNKIQETVEENRKKDKLLFDQSKQAAMGEMIGSIAHQWRQPLNAVAGNIQFIQYDYEDKAIDQDYIDNFVSENMDLINFMSQTIDDFRNFFRVDKKSQSFDIRSSIESTVSLIKAKLDNSNINVDITIGENLTLHGFKSEFQQVILNLISNAQDEFIEKKIENAVINISAYNEMNFTVIKVSDNAGGISDDVIDRVFEPYFTTKDQGKGTGLGLYMSKMIVEENMKGHLSVTNDSNGAVFTLAFVNMGDVK